MSNIEGLPPGYLKSSQSFEAVVFWERRVVTGRDQTFARGHGGNWFGLDGERNSHWLLRVDSYRARPLVGDCSRGREHLVLRLGSFRSCFYGIKHLVQLPFNFHRIKMINFHIIKGSGLDIFSEGQGVVMSTEDSHLPEHSQVNVEDL